MNDRSAKVPAPENITTASWDPTEWKSIPAAEAIHTLFEHTNAGAQSAAAWYEARKRRKAAGSSALRWLAIVFFVLGGLAPIIAGLLPDGWKLMTTQAGYLVLGLAAGFLAFDRFFGLSSGWIRYMTTLAAIERLRADFAFDWTARLQGTAIDEAAKLSFLERAQTFRRAVLDLVDKETAAWVAEFQTSLADLEKAVQAQRQAAETNAKAATSGAEAAVAARRPGAVNVNIAGDPEGATEVLLDGTRVKETTAKTVPLTNILPGQHTIEAQGMKAGQRVMAAKAVTIESDKILEVTLTLS
jgi:hypothetical protein